MLQSVRGTNRCEGPDHKEGMHWGGAVQARQEATAAAQVMADSPAVAGVEE